MSNYIEDKVIVVTGAASGFGKLVSEKATALGASVVAGDINEAALNEVIEPLKAQGARVSCLGVDVTVRSEMRALVNHAVKTFGRVDVMINNAGVMPLAFFRDHESAHDAWDRCIDINIKGVLNGIAATHDTMMKQGRGHIINISSIYGNHPVTGGGVYGATKAALINMCEALRMELGDAGINVQLVNPGFVKTPLTDQNDFAMPFLMPVDKAVDQFYRGLLTNRFEITFPKRFTWMLKFARLLPYALYLPLINRTTKAD